MKTVEKLVTYDGVVHDSLRAAERHLDDQFGKRVTTLGHKFAPAGVKYSEFAKLVEDNLPIFAELLQIKADMELAD